MNEQNLKKLTEELIEEGALEKEAEDLTFLSKNLSNLYSFERSTDLKTRFIDKDLSVKNKFFTQRQIFATALLSLILLLGFTSIVGAQNSLPGESLYPVKRLSEDVISFIKPDFKSEVLKRRSEEIKELSGKKDGDSFQNVVNEYEKELDENKTINPVKIEESRKILEEAKNNSLDEHKEDIERAINKTENKQGKAEDGDEEDKSNSSEDSNEGSKDLEDSLRF